jgi:hypothetical protein
MSVAAPTGSEIIGFKHASVCLQLAGRSLVGHCACRMASQTAARIDVGNCGPQVRNPRYGRQPYRLLAETGAAR